MKIAKLELKDYKCFERFVLDDLGSRVVLVGPNGCGKSSVLEAVSVLKEFSATYHQNESFYYRHIPLWDVHRAGWPADIPSPVRSDCASAVISASFEFDDTERAITGTDSAIVSVQIERLTGMATTTGLTEGVRKLFRHFDPNSGIGVIDYISPHRTFPIQRLTSVTSQILGLEQQRNERIEFQKANYDYQKFRNIKQYILSQELEDMGYNRPYLPESGMLDVAVLRDSLALLRQLFQDYLGRRGYLDFGNATARSRLRFRLLTANMILTSLALAKRSCFQSS
ncbi:MAG TPA: AAA family ATPase [Isosphaeraceae bacterium]|jgi:energy-coupling factor transporter ATP-binding protein EcfA2|nr:AAA family ATPase [Isosphaeraceae bacterium]